MEDIHQAPRLHPAYLGAKRRCAAGPLQASALDMAKSFRRSLNQKTSKSHKHQTDVVNFSRQNGWNPQHSPNRSHSGHDLFCHASWLKIHLQNKFSNTDETYQPLRPCDILHAYRFDDQVGSRLLAPWNLTSQHSLILKRDRLHMHHMPTPYLSPKHPYAERANVLFAVMMSTGCSLCLGLDTFLWFSPPWQ